MKKYNYIKGRFGESLVEKYLKKRKFKIIEKNYTIFNTETDIIAKKDNILVFIEVKSRKNYDFGIPSEAVDKNKIKKLKKNAEIFLTKYGEYYEGVRFDVIEVNLIENKVTNHIEGAF